jgi:hypothetical protein
MTHMNPWHIACFTAFTAIVIAVYWNCYDSDRQWDAITAADFHILLHSALFQLRKHAFFFVTITPFHIPDEVDNQSCLVTQYQY